jgi:hypothetical protein
MAKRSRTALALLALVVSCTSESSTAIRALVEFEPSIEVD